MDESGDEVLLVNSDQSDLEYDTTVALLEGILINDEFDYVQMEFFQQHCDQFEFGDENRLEYTDVYRQYIQLIEDFIVSRLKAIKPDFDMAKFLSMMNQHKDELNGEVFDILLSLSDFLLFKENILDFKQSLIDQNSMDEDDKSIQDDLNSSLQIISLSNLKCSWPPT